MLALEKAIQKAPTGAGVYIMKDDTGDVIYIGKAKNIKKRLKSYLKAKDTRYHIDFLVRKIASVEFISTSNDKEALIIEDRLIKSYKPKYNIQLKDDKRYLCLMLNKNKKFPKFELVRKVVLGENIFIWGPYPSAKIIRDIIATVHKLFPLRQCSDKTFNKAKKPCFYYHIQLCKAPCVGLISEKEYNELLEGAIELINGNNKKVLPLLKHLMWQAVEREDFEKAAFLRDFIQKKIGLFEIQGVTSYSIGNADVIGTFTQGDRTNISLLYLRHGQIINKKEFTVPFSFSLEETLSNFIKEYYREGVIAPQYILVESSLPDRKDLETLLKDRFSKSIKILYPKTKEMERLVETACLNASTFQKPDSSALQKLQKLLGLEREPIRIECFDVAHMMGMKPLCAMTVMVNGLLSKSDYRLFNFEETSFDDYLLLYKALKRRFNHSEWPFPDILLIDGGKGQLSVAKKVLSEFSQNAIVPIAITKEDPPHLYLPNAKNPLHLDKGDPAYKLLSLLREEAHKFANRHLKRRLKKAISSS